MKNKQLPAKTAHPLDEIRELQKRMENAEDADPKDVDRLRRLLVEPPEGIVCIFSTTQAIRDQLIEKMSFGEVRAAMLAEGDKVKKDLDYDNAPPLEQLLIEHILTLRLRLNHAEHVYNETIVGQSVTLTLGAYRDNLLTTTQARFLRAIETLARVRRLARNTPALQINIASQGGKQVNVAGDVNGQQSPPGADATLGAHTK